MSLSLHRIAADGTVSPSLVCPYYCGFHDYVRLVGWTCEDEQQATSEP
jgi:hypothetical protein